eukprot:468438-Ditylum_brightwellii.AAC.1
MVAVAMEQWCPAGACKGTRQLTLMDGDNNNDVKMATMTTHMAPKMVSMGCFTISQTPTF